MALDGQQSRQRAAYPGGDRSGAWTRPGPWALAVLAVGLIAASVVLAQRSGVEAGYRQVALVAELPGNAWGELLDRYGAELRELGVAALLLPAEWAEDAPRLEAVRASGFPVFLFWHHGPAPGELRERVERVREAGISVAWTGGVGSGTREDREPPLPPGDLPQVALVELEGNGFWAALARREPGRAVVAHWVPPSDWDAYPEPGAGEARLARYLRAVRERQVRVVVVPLVHQASQAPGTFYLEAVAQRLQAHGFSLGRPPALPPFGAGPLTRALMGAAVGAGLLLAAQGFFTVLGWRGSGGAASSAGWWALGLAAAGTGLAALVPSGGAGLSGTALVAFLAAVTFPTWALLSLRGAASPVPSGPVRPVAGLARATLVAVAGGVLVGGLLSGREALLRLELFRGVKMMHLLPPLAVAVALFPRPLAAWTRARRQAGRPRRSWMGRAALLLGLVVLAAGGVYYLGRTGNELVPVPPWERELRDWIEAVLGVRPRFKELLGHAALLAGLAVVGGRSPVPDRRPGEERAGRDLLHWGVGTVLLAAGSVGQVSVVNSFAHLHQPVLVTLYRVGYGWLGGLVLGLALAAAARWGLARWERWAVSQAAGER